VGVGVTAVANEKTGSVKKWFMDKKYGFIKPDDGSADVMLHISILETAGIRLILTDQRVRYTARPNLKDPTKLRADWVAAA
jgi:cold shock protein